MPVPALLTIASVLAGLVLLGNAVIGEYALGLVELQSEMVWFFLFASLSAGVIEELVFRGYLVLENKGRNALVLSCIGFSLLFALIHGRGLLRRALLASFLKRFTILGFYF